MSWSLCTSGAAVSKAGAGCNTDIRMSGAALATWSDETEGYINAETRRDWIGEPPEANMSGAVAEVASSHIANKMIAYDMSGYTSRLEAGTMLDVNADIIRKGIAFLKKKEDQKIT